MGHEQLVAYRGQFYMVCATRMTIRQHQHVPTRCGLTIAAIMIALLGICCPTMLNDANYKIY